MRNRQKHINMDCVDGKFTKLVYHQQFLLSHSQTLCLDMIFKTHFQLSWSHLCSVTALVLETVVAG
jgi:hypothetical protein